VKGSYYKNERIARIQIELVKRIDTFLELKPYVVESGLVSKSISNREKGVASLMWFNLARKMSGNRLYLYIVRVIEE